MAVVDTPQGREFSGYFVSLEEAKETWERSQRGSGLGQMAQAFAKAQSKM
jgi:hypothetical protein